MEETLGTCIKTTKYTKKNGEEVIKQYNQQKYNKNFYEKHKDKLTQKFSCECGGKYLATNKYNHEKGKLHNLYKKLTTENSNSLVL